MWGKALERISLLGCVFRERLGRAHNLKSPYIAMFFHIPGINNAVAAKKTIVSPISMNACLFP